MMRVPMLKQVVPLLILAAGLALGVGQTAAQNKFAEINKAELEKCLAKLPAGTRHEHIMMPLRDGVKLATDIFRPPQGDGPWPVMLLRTPYSRFDPRPVQVMDPESCVLVVQNQRGRYGSEGTPPKDSFANEVEDSYDAIEWCAKQKWCNGKVAMWGPSGHGIAVWSKASPLVAVNVMRCILACNHIWILAHCNSTTVHHAGTGICTALSLRRARRWT
jgi:putative CocE/NonD family hydrolase